MNNFLLQNSRLNLKWWNDGYKYLNCSCKSKTRSSFNIKGDCGYLHWPPWEVTWSMVQTPIESENFLFLNWNRFKEFQCSGASIFFVSLKKYICQPSRDFYKEKIHICPSQNINICSTFIRWIGQSTQIPFKTNVNLRSLPFMKA